MEIRFHRLASPEFMKAVRWYARRSERAAERFIAAVDAALDKIKEDPYRWPATLNELRWVRLRRFPYFIHFQITNDATVQVLAFAHGRRRPGYWMKRTTKP